MFSALIICSALAGGLLLVLWNRLPVWFARPLQNLKVQELSLHASGEDGARVEEWSRAVNLGIRARLQHRRGHWLEACEGASAEARPVVLEGAAFGCGALRATYSRQWRSMPSELVETRPQYAIPAHLGIGLWGAMRFGRGFEEFLQVVQAYDPWWRNYCLDGYGFKFGLLDYMHDRRSLSHIHSIPGYFRRAAFHGVGRAMYFAFLSDRRGFIEAAGDFAPQHDGDVVEGAAFAAAYTQPENIRRAIHFVRAMPYEWRARAHLGMTIGFQARAMIDAAHFEKCLADLARPTSDAIRSAVALAGEMEARVRRDHGGGGHGLWRDKLCERMWQERQWEPVYVDVSETRSGGEGAVR